MYITVLTGVLITGVTNLVIAGPSGTANGEASDETGQQGLGMSSDASRSNIVKGRPDIIMGRIAHIQGEQYSIIGDRGQDVTLRVTKDTNKICAKGQGASMSTGQTKDQEHQEIPPTPFMEQQAGKGRVLSEQEMTQQLRESGTQPEIGALSKDPSTLKDTVGSTDPRANEDVAKGSGFTVGDHVRIEASDMGTVTTIKDLALVSPE